MSKDKFNFKKSYEELERITADFESGKVELDDGVEKFKYAVDLADKLKSHLVQTENQVKEIKKRFSGAPRSEGKSDNFDEDTEK